MVQTGHFSSFQLWRVNMEIVFGNNLMTYSSLLAQSSFAISLLFLSYGVKRNIFFCFFWSAKLQVQYSIFKLCHPCLLAHFYFETVNHSFLHFGSTATITFISFYSTWNMKFGLLGNSFYPIGTCKLSSLKRDRCIFFGGCLSYGAVKIGIKSACRMLGSQPRTSFSLF